jgi:ribosomal-protein-alanine N-acetyltransferase
MAVLETEPTLLSDVDWRTGLPILANDRVVLRELRLSDAESLLRIVRSPEIAPYVWPPPAGSDAFRRFIKWAHRERARGKYVCFGIVPFGGSEVVGLFELRQMQPGFFRGELGFFVEPHWWGTGVFSAAAQLLLDFALSAIGVRRIEARVAVDNVRGNLALRKVGAVREGLLHGAFVRNGTAVDQYLWAIVAPLDDRGRDIVA